MDDDFFGFNDDGSHDDKELIYFNKELISRIVDGLATMTSIFCIKKQSSRLANLLNRPYLASIIKDIEDLESKGQPDWYDKSILIDKLLIINQFMDFIKNTLLIKTSLNNDFIFINNAFEKFKAQYITWDN